MTNIINILKFRGLLYNKTHGLNNFFKNRSSYFYIGIDPTYKSLHIGHLLGLSIINKLYKMGFKNSIVIIGGATAKINNKYKNNIIKKNIFSIKKQILKLIHNKNIVILNNIKWFKKINFIKFVKDIFSVYSINSLLKLKKNKELIRKNLPISFPSFIYHLMQAYDYFYLYKKFNCKLQIGGSDQWYNILSGTRLIKKKINKSSYGFTYPLLLNNKGYKFSKSNKLIKNIWISKKKTSIYELYQYLINLSDSESINYFKKFINLKNKKIIKIIKFHNKNKKLKFIQKYLVKFFISWIHGCKRYKVIKKIMYYLFKINNVKAINVNILEKYMSPINIYIKNRTNFTFRDIINRTHKIFKSNKEYNNYLKNNGVILINGKKFYNKNIKIENLLKNKFLIIKKGKKDYYLLKIYLK